MWLVVVDSIRSQTKPLMNKTKLIIGAAVLFILGAAYGRKVPVVSTVAAKLPGATV